MALIAVCRVEEVPEATALCKRLPGGLQVALTRLAGTGRIVAFENRCPHFDGPIGLGKLRDGTVICPWHFFRFDLGTGEAVGMQSIMRLRIFTALVNDQQIYIDV